MSEFSVIGKEIKRGIKLSLNDVLMVMTGMTAGICSHQSIMGIFCFCIMGYFFQKSWVQFMEFVLSYFLVSAFGNTLVFYQSFLLFLFFCLLVLFVRVIHASLFHWMPWIVSASCFLMVLVQTSNFLVSMKAACIALVLMKLCSNEKILVQKDFVISEMMFSVLLCAWLVWFENVLSLQQFVLLNAVIMCAASLMFESSSAIALFVLLYLLSNGQKEIADWLLPSVSLIWMKKMRGSVLIVYPLICALFQESIRAVPSALFASGAALCLPKRESLSFLNQEDEEDLLKVRLMHSQKMLQHHLRQFSQLFDLIADYYEDSFQKETEFLRGMAGSMSRLSLRMKQCALSQEDEAWKITELLKGYHYSVNKVYVSYGDDGSIRISISLYECLLKDVDDVILPLLQMNISQSLRVVSCRKANKLTGMMHLELSSGVSYRLKTKCYRMLNEEKISGDTCAVFQYRNYTVCTLSDGMGIGKKASRASSFVTELAQRLLSCGMPIEHIVKCINSICALNDSEHFATLDFMCFDSMNHQIVMAKNGAAPSYLIRDRQAIKIEGHSLPLGIVNQISADCYQMEVKKKDLIVMCSDGCSESMIQTWLKSTDMNELKQRIGQSLKESEKKDDMSVIIAEVL